MNNQLVIDFVAKLAKYGVRVHRAKILTQDGEYAVCKFDSNQAAVEHYISQFKKIEYFPSIEQLEMILQFHKAVLYRAEADFEFIINFIHDSSNSMRHKQYLVSWLEDLYSLNLASIKSSSLAPPASTGLESTIEVRLFALLSAFYNLSPLEITELQLFSVALIKPNYCFKSHCGNYILVVPQVYTSYIFKCISQTKVSEFQSCSKYVNGDYVRTF